MENSNKILEFFKYSDLVKTLKNIADENEDIEIKLRSERDWIALNQIIENKDSYCDILEKKSLDFFTEYIDEKNYLFNFYIVNRHYYSDVNTFMKMYDGFNFHQMMEAPDLHEYFFQRAFYLPNRKIISFFPFLNSFLENKNKYGKHDFYRFLRVFNEYTKRMKWVKENLHHCFDSFCPFRLKELYSEEDFQWIEYMLFPKEMFKIMDEGYDSHKKIIDLFNLNNEKSNQMKDLFESNNIVFAGSSLMYLTLRDYPIEQINDFDIWYLDKKNDENNIDQFVFNIQNIIDSPIEFTIKKGIIDINFTEKNIKFEILNVHERDGYSVIRNFDFSCVRAFLRQKVNNFIFTTDFCESVIHKKLFDVYHIENLVRQFTYMIQKRIDKYQKRGFELSTYLQSIVDDYEPNPEIDEFMTSKNKYKSLSLTVLKNLLDNKYFKFNDMFVYNNNSDFSDIVKIQKLIKNKPSQDVNELNKQIFCKHFYVPFMNNKINDRYFVADYIHIWKFKNNEAPLDKYAYLYSKIIFIDFQSGDLLPYLNPTLPIPIENIMEKYSLEFENVHYSEFTIFLNYQKKTRFI